MTDDKLDPYKGVQHMRIRGQSTGLKCGFEPETNRTFFATTKWKHVTCAGCLATRKGCKNDA